MTISMTTVQIKLILLSFSTTFPMSYQNLRAVCFLMLPYRGKEVFIYFSEVKVAIPQKYLQVKVMHY